MSYIWTWIFMPVFSPGGYKEQLQNVLCLAKCYPFKETQVIQIFGGANTAKYHIYIYTFTAPNNCFILPKSRRHCERFSLNKNKVLYFSKVSV